jgi:hypothetical protein
MPSWGSDSCWLAHDRVIRIIAITRKMIRSAPMAMPTNMLHPIQAGHIGQFIVTPHRFPCTPRARSAARRRCAKAIADATAKMTRAVNWPFFNPNAGSAHRGMPTDRSAQRTTVRRRMRPEESRQEAPPSARDQFRLAQRIAVPANGQPGTLPPSPARTS